MGIQPLKVATREYSRRLKQSTDSGEDKSTIGKAQENPKYAAEGL
jgi:hypothetical protein